MIPSSLLFDLSELVYLINASVWHFWSNPGMCLIIEDISLFFTFFLLFSLESYYFCRGYMTMNVSRDTHCLDVVAARLSVIMVARGREGHTHPDVDVYLY